MPGSPDLVLPRHRKVILVHGCYWHVHRCRFGRVVPRTNAKFWQAKRAGNVARDRRNLRRLRQLGWQVLVVWECQTREADRLEERLRGFLERNDECRMAECLKNDEARMSKDRPPG